ncbi:MAG TPA: phosphatase domain-containing protein [Pyrinomonadaceae bacterium]
MFKDKFVTVYPTYGYRRGDEDKTWKIPLRVWVHKQRRTPIPDDLIRFLLDDEGTLKESEVLRCRECIVDFVADDDSGEEVSFKFDTDDEPQHFSEETNHNGLVEQVFELSDEKAQKLLAAQQSTSGWLRLTVEVEDFQGVGKVRLLEPEGLSVVSDIDDTIKISEIPAGRRITLRNAFLRDYVVAPEMLDRYRRFGDVSFHYVSGSPWQLFGLLHAFLIEKTGFPEGTFHMKSLRKNLLDLPGFLRDAKEFIGGRKYTKEQKIEQISELMSRLRKRRFILIGDSGELDPEVFSAIKRLFHEQVEKIIIRDVVEAKINAPHRLVDVDEVIESPLITHGQSQFD